jgi:hypothetical protein
MRRLLIAALIAFGIAAVACGKDDVGEVKDVGDAEDVTFFPTYGYREGDHWTIPLRVWVHEPRGLAEDVVTRLASAADDPGPRELDNLRRRIADLVADDESGEAVAFKFDGDPDDETFRVQDAEGQDLASDLNGVIAGLVTLSDARARALLAAQGSTDGWLTFHAVSVDHRGVGRLRLLEPTGLSVISDVDDTIKVTEIPAGKKIVVRNTFFRDFVAAPGMAQRYRDLGDAAFHYVSGGPWQLYEPLWEFLVGGEGGFPEGSIHMKNIRKNLLSADSWEDLHELAGGDATFNQKVSQISEILERFPAREFILVGDSGEKDPEVYRRIRESFPEQIREIRIRDVVNEREKNPERLSGMTVIEARTVEEGESQF